MNRSDSPFPEPAEILPHGEGMVLIDRVLTHRSESTECRVVPGESEHEPDRGPIRPWVGIEYMGQAACVHTVLASKQMQPPRGGMLIGARDVEVNVSQLPRGEALIARARALLEQGSLLSLQCSLRVEADARPLLEGCLTAYVPEDLERGYRGTRE